MYRKFVVATVAALLVVGMVAGMAFAAVTFDPVTGTGFVGKGDVQLALGWNNKQLQDNAGGVSFTAISVTETTWECVNSNNQNIQERLRTTTTQGVLSAVAREKNQITGFNLTGYSGAPTQTTEGPTLNSCPGGPWLYVPNSTQTNPVGDPVLSVNGVPLQ